MKASSYFELISLPKVSLMAWIIRRMFSIRAFLILSFSIIASFTKTARACVSSSISSPPISISYSFLVIYVSSSSRSILYFSGEVIISSLSYAESFLVASVFASYFAFWNLTHMAFCSSLEMSVVSGNCFMNWGCVGSRSYGYWISRKLFL